jgi:hypothetical protein
MSDPVASAAPPWGVDTGVAFLFASRLGSPDVVKISLVASSQCRLCDLGDFCLAQHASVCAACRWAHAWDDDQVSRARPTALAQIAHRGSELAVRDHLGAS